MPLATWRKVLTGGPQMCTIKLYDWRVRTGPDCRAAAAGGSMAVATLSEGGEHDAEGIRRPFWSGPGDHFREGGSALLGGRGPRAFAQLRLGRQVPGGNRGGRGFRDGLRVARGAAAARRPATGGSAVRRARRRAGSLAVEARARLRGHRRALGGRRRSQGLRAGARTPAGVP